ncbi:tyrosine-type recombinase/integrase [Fictibacillus sp. JL2B1089]|uniref:site-specific integrase n=1 Tax=Fictibacillus sp. JL2B1089 TaxID=3399565 RepID=UPI003A85A1D1
MKGSIIKKGSTYMIRFDVGRGLNSGKRIQKAKGGFKTKKEAQEYLVNAINEVNQGTYLQPSNEEFSVFIERWFNTYYKRNVAETTADISWCLIKGHLIPYFNKQVISSITTYQLDCFYSEKLEEGYAAKTIRELHSLLRRAFEQAIKWSLLKFNPAVNATPPKEKIKERNTWSKNDIKKFIDTAKLSDEATIYIIAIFTGMRRGEILGLKWQDIDFDLKKIYVTRSLAFTSEKGLFLKDVKTSKSRRQISLSPYIIDVLRQHQVKQNNFKEKLGEDYTDNDLVFTSLNGNFKDPRNLLREFSRLTKKADLIKISFHDLRHTHATLLLKNGENPKVVSERLGHSRVGITLDLYSHVTDDIQEEAALRLEESFFNNF